MPKSDYPNNIDRFPKAIANSDGVVDLTPENLNKIQEAIMSVQNELGVEPSKDKEDVRSVLENIIDTKVTKGTPMNLNMELVEDENGDQVIDLSFSYVDNKNLEYFILEVWDEERQKYVPYDNKLGVIRK
jgi:hypothetical protein